MYIMLIWRMFLKYSHPNSFLLLLKKQLKCIRKQVVNSSFRQIKSSEHTHDITLQIYTSRTYLKLISFP